MMMEANDIFQVQQVIGDSVQVGDMMVTPQSEALIVRLPFGGLVWHRPTAVLVEQAGQVSRIPIVDVTRLLQWTLLGLSALAFMATFWIRSSRRKETLS
jgi:hypothetical protein